MQIANDLLSSLHQRGVKMWTEDGQLRFQAPAGTILPNELDTLRARKAEIIELLEQSEFRSEIPLQPRPPGCFVPLTTMQRNLWNYIAGSKGGVSKRVCTVAERVQGPLDVGLLRECISTTVRHHESLRTRIVTIDGVPAQHIDADCDDRLEEVDIASNSAKRTEQGIKDLAGEFVDETIDLAVGPLFKARLFRLSADQHVLILALDHTITDGVSKGILSTDIWTSYDRATRGLALSLPQLPLQFPDFAVWQQRMYRTYGDKHEAYWKSRVAGTSPMQLPRTDGLPEMERPIGAILHIPFGDILSRRLRELAQRERTTLSLVVLTVYVAVLSRWCHLQDLLIKLVLNGRDRPALESMIGYLANVVYLRMQISDEDSFYDLLQRAVLEFYAAYEHQDIGVDWFSNATELTFNWRPASRAERLADAQRGTEQVEIQPFPFRSAQPAAFMPLFAETDVGIGVTVLYRPDLFSASTVARFGHDLCLFAEEFTRHPLGRVKAVSTRTL